MYYRVAMQKHTLSPWQWKSTALSSLDALFQWLRIYSSLPLDRLHVFSARAREEINELLARENNGLHSSSVTAAQFLQERGICSHSMTRAAPRSGSEAVEDQRLAPVAVSLSPVLKQENNTAEPATTWNKEWSTNAWERRRFELEHGTGGDHDVSFTFALPVSMPQLLAWMRLLVKVQRGELQP